MILKGFKKKIESNQSSNLNVVTYMVDTYSKSENSRHIDGNQVIIKNSTLIGYPDFLSYNSLECIFELSDKAIEATKNPELSVHGLTFII
jgi:hypothetical protein